MDDIDRDIRQAQIGKRDEVLVNPYPAKDEKDPNPYLMPPLKVKGFVPSHLPDIRDDSTLYGGLPRNPYDDDKAKSGWWIVGLLVAVIAVLLVLVIIGAKLIGMW